MRNLQKIFDTIPKLVFIGTPEQDWHGMDKIELLAKLTEKELEFHIIGPERQIKRISNNIKYYGYLQQEEYTKVIADCDIGIGTLALHRKNMNEANSLKVREYLAYGLPTIIGYSDTHFLDKEIPDWLLVIENNEKNIVENIEKIIQFSNKLKDYVIDHNEIIFLNSLENEIKVADFFKKVML